MLKGEPVGAWLAGTGPESDVVISSRVRLARNLADVPFVGKASSTEQGQVVEVVRWALHDTGYLEQGSFFAGDEIDQELGNYFVERHLVSPGFVSAKTRRALYLTPDETVSLMVNEEDHLRFQVLSSGLDFPAAFEKAAAMDERFEQEVAYAFSAGFGFLTACPTNVGTGMRASVLVHLPALVVSREIEKVLRGALHMGLAVRGLYGEGTETKGNLFQISNQRTLGLSETEVLESVTDICRQVVEYERKARDYIMRNLRVEIEDKVCRAMGLLKTARILTSEEATNLLALVRLGVVLGIVNEVTLADVGRLMLLVRPANLQAVLGENLLPAERDERRATFVRQNLVR